LLEVRTGCRLHFGLMELAPGAPLRFAGLGLMLKQPGYHLALDGGQAASMAVQACVADELKQRIRAVIDLRSASASPAELACLADCCVDVQQALPLHSGLGAGTQLACAVATGLEFWLRHQTSSARTPTLSSPGVQHNPLANSGVAATAAEQGWQPLPSDWTARDLLRCTNRGLRSAIGLSGFQHGGLLLDEGYTQETGVELAQRPLAAMATMLKREWRVVLLIPNRAERVHGRREAELIDHLGRTPHAHAKRMLQLARQAFQLAQGGDFEQFTDCLEQYMRFGGQLFYPFQKGLYNGPEATEAVELASLAGLRGVGQSSWGPTVFGFAEDPVRADSLAQHLAELRPNWTIKTAVPADTGAQVRWLR
jgi:beta-ribofuranosylaminobenzene 5'-phosphate synthase